MALVLLAEKQVFVLYALALQAEKHFDALALQAEKQILEALTLQVEKHGMNYQRAGLAGRKAILMR